MSWLPSREKLDPVQASAVDFAVAQEGSFYIKGEAGTGKSVVLAHIAKKYKHDNPDAHVAVLSYTNAFAAYFSEAMEGTGVDVETILKFSPPKGVKYDLVVIDEAQDIRLAWVKRIKKCGKKFIFAADFSQMIFGSTNRVITEEELIDLFDISQKPIELKLDYRLPESQRGLLSDVYQDGRKFISKIKKRGEQNRITLYHAKSWDDEVAHTVDHLTERIRAGRPGAVLFDTNHKIRKFLETAVAGLKRHFDGVGDAIFLSRINAYFSGHGLRFRYLGRGFGDLREGNEKPLIYVMTWHGSKGLDFESVALPDLGRRGANVKANTFYVAMTRSRKNLLMSYSGEAGPQTQSARLNKYVDFRSQVQNDFEQPSLF